MTERNGTVDLPESVRSRRTVLAGGGAACLAMILTACGGDTETPPVTTSPNPTTGGAGTPSGGPQTPAGETPGETGSGSGSGGEVLAKVSEIPAGGAKVVGAFVIVKLAGGDIKAYDARCTHQRTPVVPAEGGQLVCPSHGSIFKPQDGSVTKGPATVALRVVDVKVEGDDIVRA